MTREIAEKNPADDKRKAILDSALILFTERGFHGTPTSLIAKEAGVATGTLFHYFKTKENLIGELYLGIKREAGGAMRINAGEMSDVYLELRNVARNYVSWGVENPAKIRFMEQFCLSPYVPDAAREEAISNFLFLSGLFERGMKEGIIKDIPTELAVKMAAEFLNAVIDYIVRQGPGCKTERVFDLAYPVLGDGLRNRPG